ncbi:MAG: SDR family oxidoreductase [Candidatus Eremiobacteraeota bacterium]|nr:SDR family oxidoreductase [Candidatus Eremiobacteraeota bacterium]
MTITTTEPEARRIPGALHGAYVVTGGAAGLGAAIVSEIHRAGGTPVALDIARGGGDTVDYHQVDVSDARAVKKAVDETASRHGGLAGVVANAGIDACGPFDEVPFETWQHVIEVNLIGVAAVVRAAMPYLLQDPNGRIVNVASTLGLRALSDASAYCASKFGVVGFTRALAAELSGKLGVTLLIPGGMSTTFFDGRDPKYKPGADARLNNPQDVAKSVIFALSQPRGCDIRELLICPNTETSWP